MSYDLWYWPSIQGRGEFVRLALEAAEQPYRDRARDADAQALVEDLEARSGFRPYAPPYLVDGDHVVSQVAHVCAYLAGKHDFGGADMHEGSALMQVQLTVTDIVAEVHDTHHPVEQGAYYKDQEPEAERAAKEFRDDRMPKYFAYFEDALSANDGPFAGGQRWTHVDTSLFQLVEGLRYAFPKRMKAIESDYPRLIACRDAVADLPGIAAYLKSDRRIPFNENGIFRHYPELDGQ
ncbi:glutathione S-transferase [Sphingomicrobium sp. XHP0239]|uniref:glutathione S-transferase n=1 Tax=Sphingomicrobium maritimum TaxID=3133972 RepID=UPI0031CC68BC